MTWTKIQKEIWDDHGEDFINATKSIQIVKTELDHRETDSVTGTRINGKQALELRMSQSDVDIGNCNKYPIFLNCI